MYNSNNNIANSRCSFTDSKWNDTVVFSSNDVLGQLEGDMEV